MNNDNIKENGQLIPLAIVIAGVLIAGAIYFGGSSRPSPFADTGSIAEASIEKVNEKDHIIGSRNAEVIVIEYSDTECPFCKVFHNTMRQIMESYGDGNKVAWVYRHFPIASLHKLATKEAEATECAAEQGGNTAFWNYINRVFEKTGSNDSLDPKELPAIAAEVGLDVEKFNACLSGGKYTAAIQASVEEAIKAGARGTPYSIIIAKNGDTAIINGAEPFESVKTKIDSLLK